MPTDSNYLGKYTSVAKVWEAYPSGGIEGNYVLIGAADEEGTRYNWNKYKRQWLNAAGIPETTAREMLEADGDVFIQNNLTVGGTLRAKRIKQPCLGLFLTEAALEAKWPDPEVGMWALVGEEFPATVYVCETDGEWSETEATAGPDDVDLSSIIIYGIKHYIIIDSISDLPEEPTEEQISYGYLLTPKLYVYVGTGGDTLNGKYQSVNIGGTPGTNGKSAYQSYLDTTSDNPPLDEEDWVASLKGDQGNSGFQGDFDDFEVVNNLTQGGESAALSAEMGKVLGDAVFGSGTRTINYADLTWTSGKGVTNTGSYVSATNYYASQPFALEAGDQLSITVRGSSISVIAKYENGTYTPVVTLPSGTDTNVDQHLTHTITTSGNYVATCLIQVFSMVVTSATPTIGLVGLVKPLERHTVNANIILEGGSFRTGDGIPYYPITARTSFTRTSHTSKFIKFNSSIDEIKSVTLETGEAIYYFCYGEDKTYLGYTQNSAALFNGTRYIKIAVTHPSELTARRNLAVTLDYSADHIVFENNVGNGINPYYFAYECPNVPIVGSDISGSTYGGDQTRRFDMGYVMLPPNYTPDGDPVPLVLFFHGSGMFKWKGGTATGGNQWTPIYSDTAPYIDLLTFICKCGYAVADCCAMTDKYSLSGDYGWDFKCAPIGLSCYASLYNYIIDNFNIRKDGVYAFGKSAGGTPTLQLAYNKGIPLRAIANMTPALEPIGTFRYSLKNSTNWLLGQFGYVNPNVQAGLVGSGDVAYVKANINNIKGWDAFTMGTDIDLPTLADAWYKYGRLDSSMPDLQAIVDATAKNQPVPMKMWASEDDDATPYLYIQMYKQMVDRGNGICILRTMPNNTGKHMSVDGSSAVRCDYQTKYGGVVNTTVAFAEMIDWFNRW